MTGKWILAAAAAVTMAAFAGEAAAQSVRSLPLDVRGTIDGSDATDDDGRSYEAFRIHIPAQHVIHIRQESNDFDSFVILGLVGSDGQYIALFHDDDSGGNLNSAFFYQSVADDTFEIRAATYGSGATGAYRLHVEDVSATSSGGMARGQIVGGWITETDNPGEDGGYYEYRDFYADAGQSVTITMRSSEFDSYLSAGIYSDGTFHEMWSDDDSGGGENGLDAQITFVAPQSGLYTAKLATYSAGQTGLFSFEVQ